MKALKITELSVQYDAHNHEQAVLHKLALDLHDDDILCLLGASGCGKTTLLKAIAGLVPLAQGKIELNQRDLAKIPVEQRNIGMIFQDYALFPHLTVAENIAFGLGKLKRGEQQAIVAEMAELVKLSPFLKRYPHELSGGQQQRVAIARSLACKPDLLLLDEPFSNIDSQVRYQLIDEIKSILKSQKVPAIFVTHSKEEAFVFADKLALMEQGKIVQFGEPAQLYQQPCSRFVADFLGHSNYLACDLLNSHTALSVLGELHGEQPLTLANGTAIDPNRPLCCLVRPQELRLNPITDGEGVPASIVASHFLGHTFEYQLQLENQRLSAYSTRHFAVGDKVTLQLRLNRMNLYYLQ
ncbi:ABC transporter ATP-binding protein [Testudinibacter sp. P80/BLE/0925]|uniref:ABC transporter ATP-binding protein n=1 Tax=Testudinibacter sp. TW-1 TaxID=3417757 RepID=UPI003D3637B5